jgi:uncharacterized protein YecE (DUF72 family)
VNREWTTRIAEGVACLGDKFGILLVQLPSNFGFDLPRLRYFLRQVPSCLQVAIEFRHPDWHVEETFALLEEYGAAYCVMSGAQLPCILRVTAPFVYVRLHGPDEHHLMRFIHRRRSALVATRIREWEEAGKEVWVYFNNDLHGHAVRNADTLKGFVEP